MARAAGIAMTPEPGRLFTIGFTRTTAEHFFERLRAAGARRIIDVRLSNRSQLAGFAKRDDLEFFARCIGGLDYVHQVELAPTRELLRAYQADLSTWDLYARQFLRLMAERRIEELDRARFDGACLLCSEATPHHCHRRLVAEYLRDRWPGVEIVHL